ncbi:MAG: helix-turn-helix domain-containing protein [Calditrichaeota bacterium]|nr:helix-turn-helix domain-containing protein [Calditrichota bacterium]
MKLGPKLRRLRRLRGLTIEELAEKADLTKGFISQLERDKTVPSITTLKQVLDVLGVDLATFFSDLEDREKNIYTRKERVVEKKGKFYRIENLIPKLKYLEMEPVLLTLEAQAEYSENFEEDEGFGFVVRGRLELTVDKEKRIVNRGDCFYIFFDNKLVVKNLTKKPAEILIVNY